MQSIQKTNIYRSGQDCWVASEKQSRSKSWAIFGKSKKYKFCSRFNKCSWMNSIQGWTALHFASEHGTTDEWTLEWTIYNALTIQNYFLPRRRRNSETFDCKWSWSE